VSSRFPKSRPAGLTHEAFLTLYRERWEELLGFFVRRVFAPEIAADLTAETFAKAFVKSDQFDHRRGEAAAWMYGIARNELAAYLRTLTVERRARDQLRMPARVLSESDADQIEGMIDFDQLGRGLQAAMRDLTPDQREAVVHRVIDGLSYQEIAERFGCSQHTARARVSRGLRRLAHTMAPDTAGQQGEP
jgi:RNA polymerase sigma-70 factor (ECF subfamily)